MDHAVVMNSCDLKAQNVGLERLTPVERTIVLVSSANFEIECGGLNQFFYNSAGDYAMETVPALEAVGAPRAAAALRAAIALFPGGVVTTEPEQRYGSWETVSPSLWPLTQGFYNESPCVFDRLCTFIDAHASELEEHSRSESAP